MGRKTTYEELEQRINSLEQQVAQLNHAKQELAGTLGQLEQLLEVSSVAIYRCEPSGNYPATFVSKNVKGQLGYEPQQFTEDPDFWANHIHPEDVRRVFDELKSIFEKSYHSQQYRFLNKDGNYRWMYDEMRLVCDAEGNPSDIIGNWTDITEHKRAEEALRESEEMARALLNTPTDVAAVLDRRGIVLDANETMRRRFQKQVHELRGVCVWDLLPPDIGKLRESSVDKVFQSGKPVRIVDERDGHWFDNVVHPVFDAKGKVSKVAILARDITEMKRKEKELEEKEAELKTKAQDLKEVNTALRVLLKQREADKAELEEKVLSNVKGLVLPYLEKVKKTSLDSNQMSCVDILESSLKEIVSPFSHKLSSKYLGLTPTEIRVANLVREGKTTKEIAEFMNSSVKTVQTHRDNIRKKIGIRHKKVNLRT